MQGYIFVRSRIRIVILQSDDHLPFRTLGMYLHAGHREQRAARLVEALRCDVQNGAGYIMSLINTQVQPFKANAFHNGKFIEVTEASLKGKWSVLIFMPAAFTFNCPTEIEDAANNYAEFQKAGAEVYIVTTDTHFSHKVWHETSPAVGKAQFPLVGDPTHQLTRAFGVHIDEEGLALRGTFVINPEGVIKTVEIHSNEIARDVSETLRKLKAAQYTAATRTKCARPSGRKAKDPGPVAGPGRQDLNSRSPPTGKLRLGRCPAGLAA
jgi:peroxiredoxin